MRDAEGIAGSVEQTLDDVRAGRLPPSVARAVFDGLALGVRLLQLAIDTRIVKLERLLARGRRGVVLGRADHLGARDDARDGGAHHE